MVGEEALTVRRQEDIIRRAVEAARAKGIWVTPGPVFDTSTLTSEGLPVRCDVTGAVLLLMGWNSLASGWLKAFCTFLDVDVFWLWRFWMGMDRDYQVQAWNEPDKEWVDDEVSGWARKLGRELFKTSDPGVPLSP